MAKQDIFPHRKDTALVLYFQYEPANSGTGKTGFTIEAARDGSNIDSSGFSIAEVDATNNPGLYELTIPASDLDTAGEHHVSVYETASASDVWSWHFRVTTNGELQGSSGSAEFTATASDGRVTDGTNNIEGATVKILDSSGVEIAEVFETDSNGLWGPVAFSADGTYTMVVYANGFATKRDTIVVSGSLSTVTGPASDIVLSAVSSASTSLTASQMLAYARRQFANQHGADVDAILYRAINNALVRVALDTYVERFEEDGLLHLKPAYSTGTVDLTQDSATVTLSGGTFPSWVSAGDEIVIKGKYREISSRDSGTQLTLVDTWGESTESSVSYQVERNKYSLPNDFLKMNYLYYGTNDVLGPSYVGKNFLFQRRSRFVTSGFSHQYVAIGDDSLWVWPPGSSESDIPFSYVRHPTLVSNESDSVDWYHHMREVLERAIDYQLSRMGGCVAGESGECHQAYLDAIDSFAIGRPEFTDMNPYNSSYHGDPNPDFVGTPVDA